MYLRDPTPEERAASHGLNPQQHEVLLDAKFATSRVRLDHQSLDKSPTLNTNTRAGSSITEAHLRKLQQQGGERDLNIPDTDSTVEFDPARGAASRKLYGEAMKEIEELRKHLLAKPEYAGLGLRLTASTHVKAPEGSGAVDLSLLRGILSHRGVQSTQEEIRQSVQQQHPGIAVRKTWTKPLPKWLILKVQEIAACSEPPFNHLVIKGPVSMSDLRRLAKEVVDTHLGNCRQYKATVTVGPDRIYINGQDFKITNNRSGKHTYPTAKIRIESLQRALNRQK